MIISSITYSEILLFAKNKPDLTQLKKGLGDLILLDVNEEIGRLLMQHMEIYALSHKPSMPDMFNAVIAKYYNINIFTLDLSDYIFVKGLKLIHHTIKPLPRKKGFW